MKARKIELKRVQSFNPITQEPIKDSQGNNVYFSYREQLWAILSGTNQGESLSTDEMMKRAQILFILESVKDGDSIFLDEGQYELIKKVLDNVKWTGVSRTSANFIEDLRNAPEVEVEEKPSEKPLEAAS